MNFTHRLGVDARRARPEAPGEEGDAAGSIPPELVAILRDHIKTHGVAENGRLFRTASGKAFSGSTVSKVWEARGYAFPPEVVASPLAARPYDLHHAAVSAESFREVPESRGSPGETAPRAFRVCSDQWHAAASGGCRLHVRTGLINRETAGETADGWSYVVGRVGLEPTTHGL